MKTVEQKRTQSKLPIEIEIPNGSEREALNKVLPGICACVCTWNEFNWNSISKSIYFQKHNITCYHNWTVKLCLATQNKAKQSNMNNKFYILIIKLLNDKIAIFLLEQHIFTQWILYTLPWYIFRNTFMIWR